MPHRARYNAFLAIAVGFSPEFQRDDARAEQPEWSLAWPVTLADELRSAMESTYSEE